MALLDFQIPIRFGLLGLRQRFGQHALLIGLRLRHRRRPHGFGALDGRVALGFGRCHVGIALDAGDVGTAHVGDVVVLVANFFDGERNHFQAHLAHVVRAGAAHAVAHHLRLLHDLLHRKLADNAAQMAFHHQPDQSLPRLIGFGEKLLRRGLDRFRIGLHLDLRHGFHRHRHALLGIKILLRRDIERHQLQRQFVAAFDHRKNHGAVAFHDASAAEAVNHQRFVRARLAIQPGEHCHQEHDDQDHQSGHREYFHWEAHANSPFSTR